MTFSWPSQEFGLQDLHSSSRPFSRLGISPGTDSVWGMSDRCEGTINVLEQTPVTGLKIQYWGKLCLGVNTLSSLMIRRIGVVPSSYLLPR